ncbi:MAG: hypothetical protein KGR42_08830 [Acidobacteria bacterium]|nr:hypothetical protein [Acidobacteriota bacterium]
MINLNAEEAIASAPLPTKATLRRRQNLLFQAWRFVSLNLRMYLMVLKGNH